MRRHEFDAALTAASMPYSLVGRAQQVRKIYHVGTINFRSQSDLGHIERQDNGIEYRVGEGKTDQLTAAAVGLDQYPRLAAASLACLQKN